MGGHAVALPALSACPGVGAPRAAGPGPGLLGRAAPDCVRGPPHGGRHHAGGGALLDWNRAGPVRVGQAGGGGCGLPTPESGGGAGPPGQGRSFGGCSARRYLLPVVGGSLTEQFNNPEVDVEASNPDLQTRTRRLHLRAATIRMKAAALGRDLELEDWGKTLEQPRACD